MQLDREHVYKAHCRLIVIQWRDIFVIIVGCNLMQGQGKSPNQKADSTQTRRCTAAMEFIFKREERVSFGQ